MPNMIRYVLVWYSISIVCIYIENIWLNGFKSILRPFRESFSSKQNVYLFKLTNFSFPITSVNIGVTIWITNRVVKNLGWRLHGKSSCKPFGPLHEAICQTKWKAAGRRSTCLVKTSVFFGLLTHHPHFTALSPKPLGKARVPICAWSMLSLLLPIPAEALPHAETVLPSWGEWSYDWPFMSFQASCLLKNMLSKMTEISFPLFILHILSRLSAFCISLWEWWLIQVFQRQFK